MILYILLYLAIYFIHTYMQLISTKIINGLQEQLCIVIVSLFLITEWLIQ